MREEAGKEGKIMAILGCVVNYCTNDYRFLAPCLEGLRAISDEIVVAVCDRFFDGQSEDRELLNMSYLENSWVQFVQYSYEGGYGLYERRGEIGGEAHARSLANTGRYVGLSRLSDQVEYVIFADVDEIGDGVQLKKWAKKGEFSDAMLLASYVYLGHEGRRSQAHAHAYLVVNRKKLMPEMLFNSYERPGFYNSFEGDKKAFIVGEGGEPMIHHYNWVRSPEELKRKIASWGHRDERDWASIIQTGGLEGVTGHQYSEVEPLHDVLSVDVEKMRKNGGQVQREFPHVSVETPESVMRRMLEKEWII